MLVDFKYFSNFHFVSQTKEEMAPRKKAAGDTLEQFKVAQSLIQSRYSGKFSAPFWQKILENGRYKRNRIVSFVIDENVQRKRDTTSNVKVHRVPRAI